MRHLALTLTLDKYTLIELYDFKKRRDNFGSAVKHCWLTGKDFVTFIQVSEI